MDEGLLGAMVGGGVALIVFALGAWDARKDRADQREHERAMRKLEIGSAREVEQANRLRTAFAELIGAADESVDTAAEVMRAYRNAGQLPKGSTAEIWGMAKDRVSSAIADADRSRRRFLAARGTIDLITDRTTRTLTLDLAQAIDRLRSQYADANHATLYGAFVDRREVVLKAGKRMISVDDGSHEVPAAKTAPENPW